MLSYYAHIIGNDQIKDYLTRMVEKKAIAHSLLFAGPDGIGKGLFAEAFATQVICHHDPHGGHRHKIEVGAHPDIRVYRPEGKIGMHSIDSMRQFSEEVYQAPYEAPWKVFILHDADRMLTYSANALLKTFEEPAPQSLIILLSSQPESLLPTILSRCRQMRFHTIPEEAIVTFIQERTKKSADEAKEIAALAQGSLGNAVRLLEEGGSVLREKILQILVKGKMSTYTELIQAAREIADQVEEGKQQTEDALRASLMQAYPDGLTSIQQHGLDKDIEGAVSMRSAKEAHAIFDTILSWYRDMHLLQVKGSNAYLFHRDFHQQMSQDLQQGNLLSLESVQKAVAQVRLALERSTPLVYCLENLFLQLGFV